MRICFLLGSFPSVSETFVLNQITGLMDLGHEVVILAGARSSSDVIHPEVLHRKLLSRVVCYQDKPANWLIRLLCFLSRWPRLFWCAPLVAVKVLHIGRYGREALSLNLFFKAWAFLKVRDYDLIVAHFGVNGLEGALMKELGLLSGKMVVFFHAVDITAYPVRYGRDVYKGLFEVMALGLAISADGKKKLLKLGCPESKLLIHPMGVTVPAWREKERQGGFKLLSVARLVEKKGLSYAVTALARLKVLGVPFKYTIIGDGPLEQALRAQVASLKLEDSVVFAGALDALAVAAYFDASDVLLAPSIQADDGDEEGLPVVLMEAMAHGVCVVTTPTGGIPELVVDGETGCLVPSKDASSLTCRLKALWDHPKELSAMTRKARHIIEARHDIAALNVALERMLVEVNDA